METSYEFRRWWKGYITSTHRRPTLARTPHHHPQLFIIYIFFRPCTLIVFSLFSEDAFSLFFFLVSFLFLFFIPFFFIYFFLFLVGVCVFFFSRVVHLRYACVCLRARTRAPTALSYTYNNNSTMNIKRYAHAKE
jgi:hypothetical protein